MTGFIVGVFLFRNRVSSKEAFEGLELGEGKLSRPVLRGRAAARPPGYSVVISGLGIKSGRTTRKPEAYRSLPTVTDKFGWVLGCGSDLREETLVAAA